MRQHSRGFTLIELLVVVAIIGILSAIGVVSYGKYKTSAEKKQAEISLNSIYLAQQEYKSNNVNFCVSECNSQSNIIKWLFDDVDDLSEQNYQFTITGSSDTLSIKAKHKTSNCALTLNEKSKLSTSGC